MGRRMQKRKEQERRRYHLPVGPKGRGGGPFVGGQWVYRRGDIEASVRGSRDRDCGSGGAREEQRDLLRRWLPYASGLCSAPWWQPPVAIQPSLPLPRAILARGRQWASKVSRWVYRTLAKQL